jgi:membrane protease YdiL (CAAX protease family)
MTDPTEPSTSARAPAPLEAAAVVILCFGWFILLSLSAVGADFPAGQGFSDAALLEMIVVECVLASLAFGFLRFRGHSVGALLPRPTWRGGLVGLMLFVATMLAWQLVQQFFDARTFEAQPISEIMSQTHVSLVMALALSIVNGLYEEVFLTGYLIEAFRGYGGSIAVGIPTLVRLLYHLYQGPIGAVSVLVFGVMMSLFYWRTKWLWPVAFAHILADLVALT